MSSTRRLTVALFLGALLGLVFLPVQATASHVHCGDEITQDTTFDSDVLGCSSPALTVTGDAVTLDLNGHILEGGLSTPVSEFSFRTSLVIENGTVRNGRVGVASLHRATIRNLHATGIGGVFVDDLLIEENQVSGDSPGCGISVYSARARVFNNEVRGCAIGLGFGSNGNFNFSGRATGNVIEGNGVGVLVALRADSALLESNTVRGNSGDGVLFDGFHPRLSVRDNRITDNGGNGIATPGDSSLVSERNVISRNAANGISTYFGEGLVSANDVISHNGLAGIDARRSTDIRLSGDLVSDNHTDGIHFEDISDGAEIADTRADRNGDDGFDIDSGRDRIALTRNHTWFNGDLGIEAVPGVIDGGGNWAKHNGNPLQCVNVPCSTKGKPKP